MGTVTKIDNEDILKLKRKIILNQPHIESKIGSQSSPFVTHFKTDLRAYLKECRVYFNPIQEGSGNSSPSNIRNISGWTNIILNHSGVNMLQCDSPDYYINKTETGDGVASVLSRNPSGEIESISFNGTSTITNVFRNLNYTPSSPSEIAIPNGQIALTGYSNQIYVVPMSHRNGSYTIEGKSYWNVYESADYWGIWNINSTNDYGGLWVRTQLLPMSKDISVNATAYPMMCLMEDKGCEFEAYKGSKYNINWTNNIGTLYGGYVDLIKGELTQTYAKKTFTGNLDENWSYYDTAVRQGLNRHLFYTTSLDGIIKNNSYGTVFSNKSVPYQEATADDPIAFYVGTPTQQVYFTIDTSLCDPTVESFSNWLSENNIDFIYELANPIHHTLTPQQIIAFKGINNLWSNTNEQVETKFWTYKSIPQQKINYLNYATWTDYGYIGSNGKPTVNGTSASHFTQYPILLKAGTYNLNGFSNYVGSDNTNYRIHECNQNGSWVKQITYKQIGNLSPVDISFTLNKDTWVKLSIAMAFEGTLEKIS